MPLVKNLEEIAEKTKFQTPNDDIVKPSSTQHIIFKETNDINLLQLTQDRNQEEIKGDCIIKESFDHIIKPDWIQPSSFIETNDIMKLDYS